jgi:hypothetical protein
VRQKTDGARSERTSTAGSKRVTKSEAQAGKAAVRNAARPKERHGTVIAWRVGVQCAAACMPHPPATLSRQHAAIPQQQNEYCRSAAVTSARRHQCSEAWQAEIYARPSAAAARKRNEQNVRRGEPNQRSKTSAGKEEQRREMREKTAVTQASVRQTAQMRGAVLR